MQTGRIDVHSHLLPGVDDGCKTLADSLACARALVGAGYTHAFCTPHVWPGYEHVHVGSVPGLVSDLQAKFDEESVPLRLMPGGEINLTSTYASLTAPRDVVTYGMNGKYALFDIWVDKLPVHFEPAVKWFQSLGIQPILAHPERMRAVQDDPGLADYFAKLGLLLQGNVQCFSDPAHTDTNRIALRFLAEDRYFMLGSDLHNPATLPCRLAGLERVRREVGESKLDELTITHPSRLITWEI